MKWFPPALLLLAAAACGDPEVSEELLVPEDVDLHWDAAFNGVDDGLGAMVPVDLMVYDADSGEPLEAVQIDVRGDGAVVVLLEPGEFSAVDPDECDASDGATDQPAPSLGRGPGRPCLDVVWDAFKDAYYTLEPYPTDGPDAGDDAIRLQTDEYGLARVYVYVDAFEGEGGDFAALPVIVSTDTADETFFLVPR